MKLLFLLPLLHSLFLSSANAACQTDGCLKALQSSSISASAFCTPYLTTRQSATTGIPTFLSSCKAESTNLSSACSCLLARSTSTEANKFTTSTAPRMSSTSTKATGSSSIPKPTLSSSSSSLPRSTSTKIHEFTTSTAPRMSSTSTKATGSSSTPKTTRASSSSNLPRPTESPTSIFTVTQRSCTATYTATQVITLGSSATPSKIVSSIKTPPASTITSISISTITIISTKLPSISISISTTTTTLNQIQTITSTTTTTVAAAPTIIGGDFTLPGATLNSFTVVQNPVDSIFVDILAPSAQEFVTAPAGTSQFLFLNYVLVPIPSSFTLSQPLALPSITTSITLSGSLITQASGGTVQFCISSTNCGPAQSIGTSNSAWTTYEQQFTITPGEAVVASMTIASDFSFMFVLGVENFRVF